MQCDVITVVVLCRHINKIDLTPCTVSRLCSCVGVIGKSAWHVSKGLIGKTAGCPAAEAAVII